MMEEEGEMEAFSKVQTDINYPYSALASEDRSSMPPHVHCAPRPSVVRPPFGLRLGSGRLGFLGQSTVNRVPSVSRRI